MLQKPTLTKQPPLKNFKHLPALGGVVGWGGGGGGGEKLGIKLKLSFSWGLGLAELGNYATLKR